MAVRGRDVARAKPQVTAIAVAVLVVVIAAVTSALVAPGGRHARGAGSPFFVAPGRAARTSPSTTGPGTHPVATPTHGSTVLLDNGPAVPDGIQHAAETPGKAVNITIDDGPDPRWTPQILDVLKRHHVHATFCMIGPQAKAHPELVRRVVAEGHRLCDHTVHHDTGMASKPLAYQKSEISDALAMIKDASGGARVYYYRAPGGAFTPPSRAWAAAHGMRPLGWNIDTKDFDRPGVDAILATVKAEIHNGPTLLFHDGGGDRAQTVTALDRSLTWLKGQGYAFSFPKVG
ncbi:MAG: polysaccharide deacetylase family protein [Streptomyces sp.]|nr:polysaccharide deacetylase family protein [Streptomyces sp.]